MAGHHIQSLQQKLNSGKGKKRAGTERNLSTTARMLTSAGGRALAEEKRTVQQQKKAKEDENRSQRLLVNAEIIKRRADLGREGMEFRGNIKSLKAPQLKDLAWSLGLEESGTREVLIERIHTHFAENDTLKRDKRYAKLWHEGRRRQAAAGSSSNDDAVQPPQPPEDMLMDIQNVPSGSGSTSQSYLPPPNIPSSSGSSSQSYHPLPPPNAPYTFPDTWTPPPTHLPYNPQPPPFPQSYGNPPPSDYYSVHHPYDPALFRF
ncbi:hypothetical protein MVEN_02307800 [Mycena venus]|uniref:SAP domain-containing protein n=1 Tax=Mycena venus TaxID=2733690 RepID=A0A8H6X4I0_9AGAR|nr:hypothetical protein MVEN_02307800 [Mycena venus]